jgi:hypothetical protein
MLESCDADREREPGKQEERRKRGIRNDKRKVEGI